MNVKSTEQANNTAKIVVEIEKQEFEVALNKAYNKMKKNIQVPGFRKGKLPARSSRACMAPLCSMKML